MLTRFHKTWSLKARIAFWASLVMAGVAVCGASLALWRVYADMRQTAVDSQNALIDVIAADLDAKLNERRAAVALNAAVLGPLDLKNPALTAHFAARPVLQSKFDVIFTADAAGTIVFDMPTFPGRQGQTIADRDYFKEVMATGMPAVSRPLAGKATAEPSIVFAAPLRDHDGRITGVMAGVLLLDRPNFLSALGNVRIGKTGYAALMTRGEHPVMVEHGQRELIMAPAPSPQEHPDIALAMTGFEGTVEGPNAWGLDALSSYRKLSSVPWTLTTAYPTAEAYARLYGTQRQILLLGVVLLLAGGALIWGLTDRLLAPLERLRQAMVEARDQGSAKPVDLSDPVREVQDMVVAYNELMAHTQAVTAELNAGRHQLRMITDNVPALISYVDADQRYTFVNQPFAREVGLTADQVIGRQVRDVRATFWDVIRAPLDRALAGQRVRFEGDGVFNGKLVHYQSNYVPDVGPDGKVRGIFAMTMNITQRKEAELRQAVSEERVRNILTNAPDAFVSVDQNGIIGEWNRQAELTFGWTRDEVIGRAMHEVMIPAELRDEHLAYMARFRSRSAAKVLTSRTEFASRTKGGQLVPVELSMAFVKDGDSFVAHVFMRDVSARKAAEQRLEASEKRLRDITNNMPAMIAYFDRHERCHFANDTALKVQGILREDLNGRTFRSAVGEESYAQQAAAIRTVLGGRQNSVEGVLLRKGKRLHFQSHFVPDKGDDGEVRGFYVMTFDISALKAAEASRAEGERRLRTIADNLPVLISYIDSDERVQFINETFREWVGVDPQAAVGRPFAEVVGSAFHDPGREQLHQALAGERVSFDLQSSMHDTTRQLHTVYVPDRRADGGVAGLYALSTDVTVLKQVERQLNEQARVDVLTGLPNRRAFDERLAETLARGRRSEQPMALIFLDIDHFKQISDTYGHGIGDHVLKEFGRRLRHSVRLTDTVARLAGDEFVVILESVTSSEEAARVARKIGEAIQVPFMLDDQLLQVTSSQGVAYLDGPALSPADVMAKADAALYEAKRAGRNTYALSRS